MIMTDKAIGFGYNNIPMRGDIAFCSDDDIPKYQDCLRWDVSSTPILFASSRLNNILNQAAILLADTFIMSIDPERKGGSLKVRDIPLTHEGMLKILDQYVKELFQWFNQKARSVRIEAHFDAFGPQNKEMITNARFQNQRQQIEIAGVQNTLFALLPPFREENLNSTELALIFANHFRKGVLKLSKKYPDFALTEQEQEHAHQIANFFEVMNTEVINALILIIAKAQFDDPDFQLPIEGALGQIAQEIIFGPKTTR